MKKCLKILSPLCPFISEFRPLFPSKTKNPTNPVPPPAPKPRWDAQLYNDRKFLDSVYWTCCSCYDLGERMPNGKVFHNRRVEVFHLIFKIFKAKQKFTRNLFQFPTFIRFLPQTSQSSKSCIF